MDMQGSVFVVDPATLSEAEITEASVKLDECVVESIEESLESDMVSPPDIDGGDGVLYGFLMTQV